MHEEDPHARIVKVLMKDLNDAVEPNNRLSELRDDGDPPTIVVKGSIGLQHGSLYYTYVTSPNQIDRYYGERLEKYKQQPKTPGKIKKRMPDGSFRTINMANFTFWGRVDSMLDRHGMAIVATLIGIGITMIVMGFHRQIASFLESMV